MVLAVCLERMGPRVHSRRELRVSVETAWAAGGKRNHEHCVVQDGFITCLRTNNHQISDAIEMEFRWGKQGDEEARQTGRPAALLQMRQTASEDWSPSKMRCVLDAVTVSTQR